MSAADDLRLVATIALAVLGAALCLWAYLTGRPANEDLSRTPRHARWVGEEKTTNLAETVQLRSALRRCPVCIAIVDGDGRLRHPSWCPESPDAIGRRGLQLEE